MFPSCCSLESCFAFVVPFVAKSRVYSPTELGTVGLNYDMARQVLCSKAGRKFFPSGDQDNVGRSFHRSHCRVLCDIPRVHRGLRKALAMETTLVTLVSAGLVVYLFWSLLRPESF